MNISEWRDVFDRMRVQDLKAMGPSDRAVFAVAAAAYRDALLRDNSTEAADLAYEFDWLLEAAVLLQPNS